MNIQNNTILITGGATGIGFALASRFLKKDNKVIITGRRADKLQEAKAIHPELVTYISDVSKEEERIALFEKVTRNFPQLNVVLNNAGIMHYLKYDGVEPWSHIDLEIKTNLGAPIHLTRLFTSHLLKQKDAAILNVTSALAHVPLAAAPVYSATKAALHSYTQSMRHQFNGQIRVIEISPTLTNTDLGIPGANTTGVPVDLFADEVMAGLARGEEEITYDFSKISANASRQERDELFKQLNAQNYA
ncbi:SDR family NAD(P)-dependent oxidoreductase [Paenibacillus sp. FSL R5-0713]|uniref:SDR family oxidoreductase n=1 Tax=Paenibacillus sp. FSL R5-0713 TaxID=2921655 RepID=UPI0030D71040